MKLDDIKAKMLIKGIEPNTLVEIISIEKMGKDNFQLIYKSPASGVREQLISRAQEQDLIEVQKTAKWDFTAEGNQFKLAMEALRINLAYYFDPMMAMHTSNVDPLPHQISAVYEHMLPKMPLRFVLADDPGAGKTIMTGLLISELLMRADIQRVLIIVPGSLVEQWLLELREKFGLFFTVFSRHSQDESAVNLFEEKDHVIARLDQVSRDEDIQQKLLQSQWDLIVIDEAHKMSARQNGKKIQKTKRFLLGEKLTDKTRHLLMLTATPHNGIEKDFNNFMSLLDAERFYSTGQGKTKKVDTTDVMRRVVKEDLIKFDGTKLFPERISETVTYKLSNEEMTLYKKVTDYVRYQMDRADRLSDLRRRGSVGFAMTALQRRLASSPRAIYQSLIRRHDKLKKRIDELNAGKEEKNSYTDYFEDNNWDNDDWDANEYEQTEEEIIDKATASQTKRELQREIQELEDLKTEAKRLNESGTDKKWEELSKLLLELHMSSREDEQRKLIIFTEHRDTLQYLLERIGNDLLGNPDAVICIHGGLNRERRRENQEKFWHDKEVRILLATDAAGEGINLQVANLMINYDLPWNPNRLEQRFGRIHRIGQMNSCHLWNIVATETREGEVFKRLLDKIEQEKQQLGGKVYDIIGKIFEEQPLHKLLWNAIRKVDDDNNELTEATQTVDSLFDTEHLRKIIQRDALYQRGISDGQLLELRKEMEKAQARKLQPHFIAKFFKDAFELLTGVMRQRETGRWEIRNVPASIRQYDKNNSKRDIHYPAPVLSKYERICFDKQYIQIKEKATLLAQTMHPAHPLMQAVINLTIENNRDTLNSGTILVDDTNSDKLPRVIFAIEHRVIEAGNNHKISVEFQFVSVNSKGEYAQEGWAPYLDYRLPTEKELTQAQPLLQQEWLTTAIDSGVIGYAADKLAAPHYQKIKTHRIEMVKKERKAVYSRLHQVITQEQKSYTRAVEAIQKGVGQKVNADNSKRRVSDLNQRLKNRMAELDRKQNLQSLPPTIISSMLVIPATSANISIDIDARRQVEKIAMQVVIAAEKALGHTVFDVSQENCGWDITAIAPKDSNNAIPLSRHIEVKGRQKDNTTITVSYNEILSALNQGESYLLAIVLVDGEKTSLHYIRQPFIKAPDGTATSVNYKISEMLNKAVTPENSIKK